MIFKLTALSALLLGGAFAASADTSGLRNANKIKRLPAGSEVVDNSYIVVLKSGTSRKSSLSSLDNVRLAANDLRQVYKASRSWTVINAFAANLTGNALQRVLDDSNVDYVEENGVIRLDDVKEPRESAPPAADIQSARTPGHGVDIYVVDTGVRITHNTFGGRARHGANFIEDEEDGDFNGHGTHCASTAAGEGFGPATSASIIGVKVLAGWGGGSTEGVISGVDWVTAQAQASGNPSVASMSLGGSASTALDTAVSNSIGTGVHYAIAAGNSNVNIVNTSPARVAEAVTVGALTEKGAKASFSNFGPGLDVWFLGQRVTAAWNDDDDSVNTISGTSMATPGVAGILAVAISNHGNSSPADLRDALVLAAPEDAIGVPSTSTKSRAVLF